MTISLKKFEGKFCFAACTNGVLGYARYNFVDKPLNSYEPSFSVLGQVRGGDVDFRAENEGFSVVNKTKGKYPK
jgi:hypothetical protein